MKHFILSLSLLISTAALAGPTCESLSDDLSRLKINPFHIQNNSYTGVIDIDPSIAVSTAQSLQSSLAPFLVIGDAGEVSTSKTVYESDKRGIIHVRTTATTSQQSDSQGKIIFTLKGINQIASFLDGCIDRNIKRVSCVGKKYMDDYGIMSFLKGTQAQSQRVWQDKMYDTRRIIEARTLLSRELSQKTITQRDTIGSIENYPTTDGMKLLSSKGYSCAAPKKLAQNSDDRGVKNVSGGQVRAVAGSVRASGR